MTSLPAPDRLLADTAWLRRLAQRLTGDAESAADLHQDVALAALAQPAAVGRSWLAAVARNLAASLRRRRRVEQRTVLALPEREPAVSAAESVAAAELQQRAVAAVLSLPQVYRDTVLLRFMQGLSLAAVAAAMGVPQETVRTRQKRALAMLRAQLAPARGERRGLAVLVESLLGWGIAMKVKHVVVAAAVLLVSLLVTVPFWPGDASMSSRPSTEAPAVVQGGADRHENGAVAAAAALPSRTEVAMPAAGTAVAKASLTVHLYWKDTGAALVDMPVQCRRTSETGNFVRTDAGGEAKFEDLEPGTYRISTYDWHESSAVLSAGEHASIEHAIERGGAVTGIVVDAKGAAVPGATIVVSAAGTAPQWAFPVGRSDARGRFACDGLRLYALVGARDPQLGCSDLLVLREGQGETAAEEIVLRLPGDAASVRFAVVDADARPVGGAWVELGGDPGHLRTDADGRTWHPPVAVLGSTAPDGSYLAAGLPPRECAALIYHQGFAPYRGNVLPTGAAAAITITLQRGGTLVGTLRDAAGNAIAGADVEVDPYDYPRVCLVETDAQGGFQLHDLPVGEVSVEVNAASFPRQRRTFAFAGAETQQWDVVLRQEQVIKGRLVDSNGLPLANWWVAPCGANRRAKTDADGHFVIAECEAEDNELIVRESPGFVPERTRFAHVKAEAQEQTFVVPADSTPSAQLRGKCIGPEGTPLADAILELSQADWPIAFDDDHCAADGGFAIGPWPKGSYRLQAQHRQFVFAPVDVELRAGETRDVGVLRGQRPAQLVLRLGGDAAALAEVVVALRGTVPTRASSGEGSERTFARVFPGRYRLVVRRGGREQDCGEVDLAPGADLARDVTVQ